METVGSLIDKMSINELKIYHVNEQLQRTDVDEAFREDCRKRLNILYTQKDDMKAELQEMLSEVLSGRRQFKLYRQLKMYNEKKFRD